MKVKCINNDKTEKTLTIGKVYEVLSETDKTICVRNDDGHLQASDKFRFKNG